MGERTAREIDLVMRLRARLARAVESRAKLDALDGIDADDGLRQPSVQFAVPMHVTAEPDRATNRDDPESASKSIAAFGRLVDHLHHLLAVLGARASDGRCLDFLEAERARIHPGITDVDGTD